MHVATWEPGVRRHEEKTREQGFEKETREKERIPKDLIPLHSLSKANNVSVFPSVSREGILQRQLEKSNGIVTLRTVDKIF